MLHSVLLAENRFCISACTLYLAIKKSQSLSKHVVDNEAGVIARACLCGRYLVDITYPYFTTHRETPATRLGIAGAGTKYIIADLRPI